MNKEDKELLIKDLCSRLPYGVKISLMNAEAYHHENIAKIGDTTIDKLKGFNGRYFTIYHDNPLDWSWYVSEIDVEHIKPYLYPLSSMTEEQRKEYSDLLRPSVYKTLDEDEDTNFPTLISTEPSVVEIDYFNKNHLDYRGLIPKGLAKDATGLNIY